MNRFELKETLRFAGFPTIKAAALHLHMSESATGHAFRTGHPVYMAWLDERVKRIEFEDKAKKHDKLVRAKNEIRAMRELT